MKKIAILGCSGSIGIQALEIVRSNPDIFKIELLAANGSNIDLLVRQCQEFRPKYIMLSIKENADNLRQLLKDSHTEVINGDEAYKKIKQDCFFDVTLHAITGIAGLIPAFEFAQISSVIAIANKESIICGGHILFNHMKKNNCALIPVDSEHNSLYQLLKNEDRNNINKVIITGSGGSLRDYEGALDDVTPARALAHPKWNMGYKCTIDSATLVNKGIELIESALLFDIDIDKVECVLQPEVIIHALIEMKDNSMRAYFSKPDMKVHIAHAMGAPIGYVNAIESINLLALGNLSFRPIDDLKYPAFNLAKKAFKAGHGSVIAYNAADEILTDAFLNENIKFTDISRLLSIIVEDADYRPPEDLKGIFAIDKNVKDEAKKFISKNK